MLNRDGSKSLRVAFDCSFYSLFLLVRIIIGPRTNTRDGRDSFLHALLGERFLSVPIYLFRAANLGNGSAATRFFRNFLVYLTMGVL